MKSFIFSLFLLVITFSYAQSDELMGTWILDRITYTDGKPLEINHNHYSVFMKCLIGKRKFKTSGMSTKASFKKMMIKTPYRKIHYVFENDYLVTTDEGDDKKYYFLKVEDFIKKYPEFTPTEVLFANKKVIEGNKVVQPVFNDDVSLHSFLSNHIPYYSQVVSSNNSFKAKFILSKDNKITDITILKGIGAQFDSEFLHALKLAEGKLINTSGQDFLVTESYHFFKTGTMGSDPEGVEFLKEIRIADDLYEENKFEEAIAIYGRILAADKLAYLKTEFKNHIVYKESLKKLGISYLAIGNREKACEVFARIGDITNFAVRNYMINFCR